LRIQIIAAFGPISNLASNDDSDEYLEFEDKKPPRKWFIIDKDSKWKLIWDIMSSVLLLLSYFLTLYTLAFWGFEEERIGEPGTSFHHLAFKN
jgi:hypothetical protein